MKPSFAAFKFLWSFYKSTHIVKIEDLTLIDKTIWKIY